MRKNIIKASNFSNSKFWRIYYLKAIRFLLGLCCGISLTIASSMYVNASTVEHKPYTDPAHFTSVPFGSYSHWLQPWRAYLETVPATRFLSGTGIQWNVSGSQINSELVAQMLAKHGVRHARVEIGWNNIDFDDPKKLVPDKAADLKAQLLALKKYKIRPLILLNAHHGVPGPVRFVSRTLTANAVAGSTTVQLDDVSGLKVGYSGLSNLTDYWAAECLITSINGNTATLSKPLPKDIKAGEPILVATLKYRPFSAPTSEDYQSTVAGWQQYVGTVTNFVTDVLGTAESSNKGFDLEIWNEISLGSHFLSINNYYGQKYHEYDEDSIWTNLVKETADYVTKHSANFSGVRIANGFANTIPWTASSLEPARINAISKHPYPSRRNYPHDESPGIPLNADGQKDASNFIPTYSALFPEHYATAIQTETLIRDMAPMTSEIYGVKHGRNARVINNVVKPTPVWITEVNINPLEHDSQISAERALYLKAKAAARFFTFYLNKGVTRVYLYAASGGDREWGIVKDSFLEYAKHQSATYLANSSVHTSPALTVLQRITARMRQGVDHTLTKTRSLEVVSISDPHNHYQFLGNGTATQPNLYNRDVFTFLPYQVNTRRFVIPYYVMTRDIMKDLPPEQYTIQIKGVKGHGASITAYDPLNNKAVPLKVKNVAQDCVSIDLTATDYPYLLVIQEAK